MTIGRLFTPELTHDIGLLLLAVLLGGVVGYDRERNEQPAGLRTHILVCVGATLICIVDMTISKVGGHISGQIITGVGFLGAGTIMRDATGSLIRGLTTAASIWVVAAIGIAIGSGVQFALLAAFGTGIVYLTLTVLQSFEQVLAKNRRFQDLTFLIQTDKDTIQRLGDALNSLHALGIRTGKFRFDNIPGGQIVHMTLKLPNPAIREQVKPTLEANPSIVHVEWGSSNNN